jgi:hypothetical protein
MYDAYQWLVIYNQYIMTTSLAATYTERILQYMMNSLHCICILHDAAFFLSLSKMDQSVSTMCTTEWRTSRPSQLCMLLA